ncbi:MAG: (2Fe-2S)-binding protein [Gammaproteobacteria bacterium]|nr:(2Fe-2S)-binding protein [Gammaproteobacteria bacterium]
MCPQGAAQEWLDYWDKSAGRYRAAHVVEGRLDGCVFIAPGIELPPRTWLAELFGRDELSPPERMSLLAGRPARAQDAGPLVCACFGVGMNTLLAAIRDDGLVTPEAVGAALKAGTNCGSCVPEIKALIAEAAGARVA